MARSQAPRTLVLSHITYTYPGSVDPVLVDATGTFPSGWTAIIGDNGCGKTTLARIACGLIAPDTGSVIGPPIRAYCAQGTGSAPRRLDEFACDFSGETVRLRSLFGIDEEMCWRYDELSSGEQKKIQVAVAWWHAPDVLVLDEPTNHVDVRTRGEILAACRRFTGIGLVVSHDRAVLDGLAERCLCFEISPGPRAPVRIAMRRGNYAEVSEQIASERRKAQHDRQVAGDRLSRLEAEEHRRAALAARTAARRSARHLDPHDSDGRARIKLAVLTGQDGRAGMLARRMGARSDAARGALDEALTARRYDGSLWLETRPHPRSVLLRVPAATIPLGDAGTLTVPELFIASTDHIGIEGPNGAGKSTLVAHMRNLLMPDIDALIIAQEPGDTELEAMVARIRELGDDERGRLLSIVAQLNSDPKRLMTGSIRGGATPSPGEARKIMLAEGVIRACPLIIMDEPTNHLDLHSTEALEAALATFPGALILVSHDETFLRACTKRALHVEDGCVREL